MFHYFGLPSIRTNKGTKFLTWEKQRRGVVVGGTQETKNLLGRVDTGQEVGPLVCNLVSTLLLVGPVLPGTKVTSLEPVS